MVDFITMLKGLIHDPESNWWLALIFVLIGAILPFVVEPLFGKKPT